jgi:DNA-binding LacI/PurR family transcriptional regulator
MNQWQRLSTVDQFTAHLRAGLLSGHWTGTMPGELRLAEEFGINRKTVKAALERLEQEGLLVGQGTGRRRKIVLPEGHTPPALRVGILVYDSAEHEFILDLRHLLEKAGHTPFFPAKTMEDLGMDVRRVARLVQKTEADAWVVVSASREVLEWFAQQETPAFAVFGNRSGLPIAGSGPDKTPALAEATRRLVALGHRRISLLCHREHRLPQPAKAIRALFDELEAAGITTGAFNLPDWEESKEGFGRVFDSLFGTTPPTALILDEPFLFHAGFHHLARLGLRVPEDVSLVCTDPDPTFTWCAPSVAHISWDYRPVVRRVVRWARNISQGKEDTRQTMIKAEFVEEGTIGPVGGGN